ncbi:uncharacterized protein EV420DRAFT_631767 [Desarmillaria tabescens]|uniref:Uncharacterized protein n=1 Tax=Armillaria tabescens TaxID=1929756 RepID=A0AA39K209_ARMTA|nr:uncharacterized protein EV420DRAFT_631767 [Desarmillaria tabescens]KAK0452933.1 hypothetical protein EV420DRAFT_631767 [Desarmillaria tabescens]
MLVRLPCSGLHNVVAVTLLTSALLHVGFQPRPRGARPVKLYFGHKGYVISENPSWQFGGSSETTTPEIPPMINRSSFLTFLQKVSKELLVHFANRRIIIQSFGFLSPCKFSLGLTEKQLPSSWDRDVHRTVTDMTVDRIKIIGHGTVRLMSYPYRCPYTDTLTMTMDIWCQSIVLCPSLNDRIQTV